MAIQYGSLRPIIAILKATPSAAAKGFFVDLSETSSMPQKRPRPRISPTFGWPDSSSFSLVESSAPMAVTFCRRFSLRMMLWTSRAAAQAIGWLWYV